MPLTIRIRRALGTKTLTRWADKALTFNRSHPGFNVSTFNFVDTDVGLSGDSIRIRSRLREHQERREQRGRESSE